MLIPDELMSRVDEWRQQQTVPPTRAAAIRHLIESALGPPVAWHTNVQLADNSR